VPGLDAPRPAPGPVGTGLAGQGRQPRAGGQPPGTPFARAQAAV